MIATEVRMQSFRDFLSELAEKGTSDEIWSEQLREHFPDPDLHQAKLSLLEVVIDNQGWPADPDAIKPIAKIILQRLDASRAPSQCPPNRRQRARHMASLVISAASKLYQTVRQPHSGRREALPPAVDTAAALKAAA